MARRDPSRALAALDVRSDQLDTQAKRAVREDQKATALAPPPAPPQKRGRPPRGEDIVQTTIRMTPGAWARLQRAALEETIRTGRKRYISDIVVQALEEYYASHGDDG